MTRTARRWTSEAMSRAGVQAARKRPDRTGAPRRAATASATAAGLTQTENPDTQADAGALWERAADAALSNADYAEATEHAGRARDHYLARGEHRAAARAQATAGETLQMWGHHAEAREQLTEALEVLRAEPDTDTVRALGQLAALEVFAGSPERRRRSPSRRSRSARPWPSAPRGSPACSAIRGICLYMSGRQIEAVAYLTQRSNSPRRRATTRSWAACCSTCRSCWAGTDPAAAAEGAGPLPRTFAGRCWANARSRDREPDPGTAAAR